MEERKKPTTLDSLTATTSRCIRLLYRSEDIQTYPPLPSRGMVGEDGAANVPAA